MKTIIILNFETGEVHIYQYDSKIALEDGIEDFIRSKGHSPSNSQWMCTDKLMLQIHEI
jgi:hypothetical protein